MISKNGASGDYPGCTDLAYSKAIKDGADIIDCSVQMSLDGIPFCLNSVDLGESTNIVQSPFRNRSATVTEIGPLSGLYSFSLTWSEIQTLRRKFLSLLSFFLQHFNYCRRCIVQDSEDFT